MEILVAHREQPIPSLSALRPDVPAELNSVFSRMVAKQSDERWQSMHDVIFALQPLLLPAGNEFLKTRMSETPPSSGAQDVQPVAPAVHAFAGTTPPDSSPATAPDVHVSRHDRVKRTVTITAARIAGAIIGGFIGASIGSFAGGLAAAFASVFYVGFGWKLGGGYASMAHHALGWSDLPPETSAGPLFAINKLNLHFTAIAIGAAAGTIAGGMWNGILAGLTALAIADRLRQT